MADVLMNEDAGVINNLSNMGSIATTQTIATTTEHFLSR